MMSQHSGLFSYSIFVPFHWGKTEAKCSPLYLGSNYKNTIVAFNLMVRFNARRLNKPDQSHLGLTSWISHFTCALCSIDNSVLNSSNRFGAGPLSKPFSKYCQFHSFHLFLAANSIFNCLVYWCLVLVSWFRQRLHTLDARKKNMYVKYLVCVVKVSIHERLWFDTIRGILIPFV